MYECMHVRLQLKIEYHEKWVHRQGDRAQKNQISSFTQKQHYLQLQLQKFSYETRFMLTCFLYFNFLSK